MTDFPPGEWSFLLVGDQWPDDQDLLALSHGKMNRGQVKSGFTHFADMLHNAQTGPLAGQQGHTADDLRDAFCQGEKQARRVADKNGVKESAYSTAYDSTVGLQHDLTSVAEEGNKQIKEIQDSKQPVEAKVTQIVAVIHQSRALASLASAKCSGNVLEAMQRILDEEGTGQSARQFAQAHGVDVGTNVQATRRPKESVGAGTEISSSKPGARRWAHTRLSTPPQEPSPAHQTGLAGVGGEPAIRHERPRQLRTGATPLPQHLARG